LEESKLIKYYYGFDFKPKQIKNAKNGNGTQLS